MMLGRMILARTTPPMPKAMRTEGPKHPSAGRPLGPNLLVAPVREESETEREL